MIAFMMGIAARGRSVGFGHGHGRRADVTAPLRRWLVLFAAAFIALSATLSAGGHDLASAAACAQRTAHPLHAHDDVGPADAACDDPDDGGGCIAAAGCGICATLPAAALGGLRQDEAFGIARLAAPAPAPADGRLRPPRSFATA